MCVLPWGLDTACVQETKDDSSYPEGVSSLYVE